MNSRRVTAFLVIALLTIATLALAKENPVQSSAIAAAEDWVALVDSGQYRESWESAAHYFRQVVTRAQWQTALEGVRSPLGNVVSRKVESSETWTSLPGAPDGQYVIITFMTVFANKASAVETITMMREKDDSWAMAGYYIR